MASELSQLKNDLDIMDIQSSLEELSVRSLLQAYRRRAMLTHPDKGGEEEDFKGLGDSYKRLLRFLRKRTVSDTDVGRMTADDQEVMTAAEFFNRNNFTQVNTICVTVKLEDSRKEAWGRALRTKFGPGKVVNSSGLQFKYGPLSFTFYTPKPPKCVKIHIQSCGVEERLNFVYTIIASLYEEVRRCSGERPVHECKFCCKAFKTVNNLTLHMANHTDKIVQSLARRGTHRLKVKSALVLVTKEDDNKKEENNTEVKDNVVEVENEDDDCTYVCMKCSKEFKTENSLKNHEMRNHIEVRTPSHVLEHALHPVEGRQLAGGQSSTIQAGSRDSEPLIELRESAPLSAGILTGDTPGFIRLDTANLAPGQASLNKVPWPEQSRHSVPASQVLEPSLLTPAPRKKISMMSIQPPSPWVKEVMPPVEEVAPKPSPLWEGEIDLVAIEGRLSKTSPELLQCLRNVLPDEQVQRVATPLTFKPKVSSRPLGRQYFGVKEDNLQNTLWPKVHVIDIDTDEDGEIIEIDDDKVEETNKEVKSLKVGKNRSNPIKPSAETFAACHHDEDQDQEENEQGFTCKHCYHKSTNLSDFWNHITVQHAGITDMKAKVDFFIFNLVEDSIDIKSRLVAALHTINFIVEDNYFLSNQVDKCFKTIMEVASKLEATLVKLDEKVSNKDEEQESEGKVKDVPEHDTNSKDDGSDKLSMLWLELPYQINTLIQTMLLINQELILLK